MMGRIGDAFDDLSLVPDWEWGENTSREDCAQWLNENHVIGEDLDEDPNIHWPFGNLCTEEDMRLYNAMATYIEQKGEDPRDYNFEKVNITVWALRDRG